MQILFMKQDTREKLEKELLLYYSKNKDVKEVLLCDKGERLRFIVIMEDSTTDSVFHYNEFGFKLSEKYLEIEDFMIIDENEANGCTHLLSLYYKIYQRD